jgi:hypothetical protein
MSCGPVDPLPTPADDDKGSDHGSDQDGRDRVVREDPHHLVAERDRELFRARGRFRVVWISQSTPEVSRRVGMLSLPMASTGVDAPTAIVFSDVVAQAPPRRG